MINWNTGNMDINVLNTRYNSVNLHKETYHTEQPSSYAKDKSHFEMQKGITNDNADTDHTFSQTHQSHPWKIAVCRLQMQLHPCFAHVVCSYRQRQQSRDKAYKPLLATTQSLG